VDSNTKDELWSGVYSHEGGMWYPSEGVIRFISRFAKRRVGVNQFQEKRSVNKVLDVGCGNGNNLQFLAEMNYDCYGIDISTKAVESAKENLNEKQMKVNISLGDSTNLQFEDNFFDIIISHGVLDHMLFSDAKKSIAEMKRVVKAGGFIFLTLISDQDCQFKNGEEVEKNSFNILEGYEKGLIQHYYDIEELNELFREFKVLDLELHEVNFPKIFTVDKAFLQTSQSNKKTVDLQNPNLDYKYSRWNIVLENT